METITFYSYKGGVGRTLALANIAVYLSRFDQNVCIIDFDLEAPGLHYKLSEFFPGPIDCGLVDYIYEFTSTGNVPGSLDKYLLKADNIPPKQGKLHLIPAGNVLSSEYWRKLASIDWHDLFYKEGGEGIPFFLELKEKIRQELKPDFLLIDSRTGITEMSGVCTSILPDKVVFLITNNRENIEGSRQILKGIQKAKRLKNQEPIRVDFALTRIPFPKDDKEKQIENKIIEDIKNFLNEDTENLDEQLNITDILVLHSDRTLELLESLQLLQRENIKDKPLVRDYLQLFSKNIPENIIKSKIDSVVKNVISPDQLFDNPDKIQEELEALAYVYPHPKSFEKLIDFYFLRNKDTDEILGLFSDLWKNSKDFSARMFSRFAQVFLKKDYYWELNKDTLEIAEEYLKSVPENKTEVGLKLADIYKEELNDKAALDHYLKVLDEVEKKDEILKQIFNIFNEQDNYKDAYKMYKENFDAVATNPNLKIPVLEIMHKGKNQEEIKKLLQNDPNTENLLLNKDPSLYMKIMTILGKADAVENQLIEKLNRIIAEDSPGKLHELGIVFYKLGKSDTFKEKIPDDFRDKKRILDELDMDYK
jgi:MinD-like ATPase involved in chromosome partitioning or flagellar assembly